MARRQSLSWVELRVGILVIASFGLLATAIIVIGGETGLFTRTYAITAYFASANGMNNGAEVWLDGVTVGNVGSVQVTGRSDPDQAVAVELNIDERFSDMILDDAIVAIKTVGLLGDSYVDVTRGDGNGNVVPPGGTIQGSGSGDIRELITGTNDVIANLEILSDEVGIITGRLRDGEGTLGRMLTDTAIFDNANAAVLEVNELVRDARTGEGTVGRLMSDSELYDRMTEMLERFESIADTVENGEGTLAKLLNDSTIYDEAADMVARANGLIGRIESGEGTLGKLSSDDALYDSLLTAVDEITTMVSNVANSEGTLGKLINEPSLHDNLNLTISEVLKLVYDFRQDPGKFLTINFRLF